MKRIAILLGAMVMCSLLDAHSVGAQEVIPLYQDAIPNSRSVPSRENVESDGVVTRIWNVTVPTMTAYRPAKDKSAGSAVLIFPGGGYQYEAINIEGTQIAEALVRQGVAAFVVKYRLPSDSTMLDKSLGPLEDAQQAILVVREHASRWGINPDKIGVMGFSAGGHLASTAGTHFDKFFVSDPQGISLRPDFMVLVYPVISMSDRLAHMGSRDLLLGKNPPDSLKNFFSSELNVTDKTPPTFITLAEDDRGVDPDNSIEFFEALRHHKVPAELVIIPKGGHGFAARIPPEKWMPPLISWMRDNGWVK